MFYIFSKMLTHIMFVCNGISTFIIRLSRSHSVTLQKIYNFTAIVMSPSSGQIRNAHLDAQNYTYFIIMNYETVIPT